MLKSVFTCLPLCNHEAHSFEAGSRVIFRAVLGLINYSELSFPLVCAITSQLDVPCVEMMVMSAVIFVAAVIMSFDQIEIIIALLTLAQ